MHRDEIFKQRSLTAAWTFQLQRTHRKSRIGHVSQSGIPLIPRRRLDPTLILTRSGVMTRIP